MAYADSLKEETVEGFRSAVTVRAAFSKTGEITYLEADTSGETLGVQCGDNNAFLSQFIDKKGPFDYTDVVSGATITSRAVINAVNHLYYNAGAPAVPVDYHWADYSIDLEWWSLAPAILNQPLKNCTGFTYTLFLGDIKSGTPYGSWALYGDSGNGKWEVLQNFQALNGETTIYLTFDEPRDIYGLCAIRLHQTDCSHLYSYAIINPRFD